MKRFLGVAWRIAAGCIVLSAAYVLALFFLTPSVDGLKQTRTEIPSEVLSSDGTTINLFKTGNRVWTRLDAVSPNFIDALIATEDHRFYGHDGVDVIRTFSSIGRTLLGDPQGGSTITQQLARNLFPDQIGSRLSPNRKLKEMVTAIKIEANYSKRDVLELYLNSVPFLYNAVGIQMAARTYYNKPASELSVGESAVLVGMLKGTSYYNPNVNPERALTRRNIVLGQMHKHGLLGPEALVRLQEEPILLDFNRQDMPPRMAPHFVQRVQEEVAQWASSRGYDIYADGLKIYTTLDASLQKIAEEAVESQLSRLQAVADVEWATQKRLRSQTASTFVAARPDAEPFAYFWEINQELFRTFIRESVSYQRLRQEGVPADSAELRLSEDEDFVASLRASKSRLETGFVAIEPGTGRVKAWVGSRNFRRDEYDHAGVARRQPGSTFKPFVYATALDQGYSPHETFQDREVKFTLTSGRTWQPKDVGGASGEYFTLSEALAKSKNTISAQLIDEVGAESVADMARKMGVRHSQLDEVPSLALGTSSVTVAEMVAGYATIANRGTYTQPFMVERIETSDGMVLFESEADSSEVLSARHADQLIDMMRGVIDHGTGVGARNSWGIRADVAGKTGTTQDQADGWFILMHPNLVAGAWVGFNDQRVRFRSGYWGQGAKTGLYVVSEFFSNSLQDPNSGISGKAIFPVAPEPFEIEPTKLPPLIRRILGKKPDRLREARRREEVRNVSEGVKSSKNRRKEIDRQIEEARRKIKEMEREARERRREIRGTVDRKREERKRLEQRKREIEAELKKRRAARSGTDS